jgi:hypothetical protein
MDVSDSVPVSRCEVISAAQIRNRLDWPALVLFLVLYSASSSCFGSSIKFCLRFSVSAPSSVSGFDLCTSGPDFPTAVFGFIVSSVGQQLDPVARLPQDFRACLRTPPANSFSGVVSSIMRRTSFFSFTTSLLLRVISSARIRLDLVRLLVLSGSSVMCCCPLACLSW